MIRIAIVDDDEFIRKQLNQYIVEFEKSYNEKFYVSQFEDAKQIVEEYKAVYDIIFMDIQMKEMDGMSAAERIRELDRNVIILFVTNMGAFAIKGYRVDALSYVIKPILYVDFTQQFTKALKKVEFLRSTFLLVNQGGEILKLDVAKIVYIESVDHKIIIHMEQEEIVVPTTLKKIEKQVEEYHFARCNSGYLVSLRHVNKVDGDMVYIHEEKLVMSRPKKKSFMNALTQYIGGDY